MEYSASWLRSLPECERIDFLSQLTDQEAAILTYDWKFWARPNQLPDEGDWTHWLLLAGRGFGKTRTGAEWVRGLVESGKYRRIALVAPTAADARDVMIEGQSGIMSISPKWDMPVYLPSSRKITWANGAEAHVYSADEPDRLRGPEHDAAWCDELAAWRYDQSAWDMLMFGLRVGRHPRTCITTTPRPTPLIKALAVQDNVHMTHGTTYDNLENLAPTFRQEIITKYEGTRLGRQELNAEILDDVPGALWSRADIDKGRCLPKTEGFYKRIVVAIDPTVSKKPEGKHRMDDKADECGLVVVGLGEDDEGYVLEDATKRMSPKEWAVSAVNLYHKWSADRIIAEVNNGGALVEMTLRAVPEANNIPYTAVVASKGKITRAEPIAALYEQIRVHHVGSFPELEDQMCSYDGPGKKSPDRMDAMVWGVTELMLKRTPVPRIRFI